MKRETTFSFIDKNDDALQAGLVRIDTIFQRGGFGHV
jgi:hypothetical protein